MRVFDMIRLAVPDVTPEATKIHLAGWNGVEDPLDEFLAGRFPAWQSHQSQKNFERPFVLSLIKLETRDRWLFAGLHEVDGPCVRVVDPHPLKPDQECWKGDQISPGRTTARLRPNNAKHMHDALCQRRNTDADTSDQGDKTAPPHLRGKRRRSSFYLPCDRANTAGR